MIPIALGTQTAGSIIRPASFCGVYGFKPSFGLVPRTGILKTTDSLDTVGFFASRAEDLKTIFNIIRVHGPNFPISHRILNDSNRQKKPETRKWKVGFCKTYTWKYVPDYAKQAFLNFCEKLIHVPGIDANEFELPKSLNNSHEIHATIYNKSLAYYFKDEYKNKKLISPVMHNLIRNGININVSDYYQAIQEQNELINVLDRSLSDFDVIISLSTAGEAPERGVEELDDPALIWTLAHLPVVGVPKFLSPNHNPFGIQIAARKYNDLLMLDFINYLLSVEMIPEGSCPLSFKS
jgi:Asp-tRNA(Asn)/Glu-tRNA(Gln) amidotransferase A subunit family amidase